MHVALTASLDGYVKTAFLHEGPSGCGGGPAVLSWNPFGVSLSCRRCHAANRASILPAVYAPLLRPAACVWTTPARQARPSAVKRQTPLISSTALSRSGICFDQSSVLGSGQDALATTTTGQGSNPHTVASQHRSAYQRYLNAGGSPPPQNMVSSAVFAKECGGTRFITAVCTFHAVANRCDG
jgi:hypothetical protein